MESLSVWAMPPPDHPGILQAMSLLREQFPGPELEPHVTVRKEQKLEVGKAIQCLQTACRSLPPFKMRLTEVATGGSFYQCIFMLVQPSPQVMQTNLRAESFFGSDIKSEATGSNETTYMPHLSLFYGDLSEEEKLKGKEMVKEKYGELMCNTEFEVKSLFLYSTDTSDKLLKSWKKLAECPLEGKSSQ